MTEPLEVDAQFRNADWIRTIESLSGVETLGDLRRFIQEAGWTVAQFKRLPIYRRALRERKPPWITRL